MECDPSWKVKAGVKHEIEQKIFFSSPHMDFSNRPGLDFRVSPGCRSLYSWSKCFSVVVKVEKVQPQTFHRFYGTLPHFSKGVNLLTLLVLARLYSR